MFGDLEFVAHVVPDPLPDDQTPAVVLDVVGGLDQGHDGAFVGVFRLPVDDRQLIAVVQLFLLGTWLKCLKNSSPVPEYTNYILPIDTLLTTRTIPNNYHENNCNLASILAELDLVSLIDFYQTDFKPFKCWSYRDTILFGPRLEVTKLSETQLGA